MRADGISPSLPIQGVAKPQTVSGKEPKFSEGDVVSARVLSVRDGTASLKTSDGAMLNARLEPGVELTAGTDVFLSVTQDGATVVMVQTNPAAAPQTPSDPLMQAVQNTLSELGITPDAETVETMKNLLSEFPEMKITEAAFLASQKLPPEPEVRAALAGLLSGENNTASMLGGLKQLASEVLSQQPTAVTTPELPSAELPSAELPSAELPSAELQASDTQTPVAPQLPNSTQLPEVRQSAQTAEPQSPLDALRTALESLTAESAVTDAVTPDVALKNSAPAQIAAEQAPENPVQNPIPADTARAENPLPEFGKWLSETLSLPMREPEITAGAPASPDGGKNAFTGEALADSPLLDGLSSRSLAGMAESLNRIAESMPELKNEEELLESISRFAEELFLRPDDEQGAEKLREVREELYVKLAYFRDAVASSGLQSKEAVLGQTEKLMDHVRLLSGLDQFVCMQVPVQLRDEQRNAELYIYKKDKGGAKRIDPEDVKILLALDLQHAGRLESLIEIKGRDVSLRFEVESDEVAFHFRQNTTKLYKMLDGLGYKFTNSSVLTKKRGTTVETALLALLDTGRKSGVDVTI